MRCRRGSNSVLRGVQSFHSHLALEVECVKQPITQPCTFMACYSVELQRNPLMVSTLTACVRPHVTEGDRRNLLQLSDILMRGEQVIKKRVWSSCQQIADTARLVICSSCGLLLYVLSLKPPSPQIIVTWRQIVWTSRPPWTTNYSNPKYVTCPVLHLYTWFTHKRFHTTL